MTLMMVKSQMINLSHTFERFIQITQKMRVLQKKLLNNSKNIEAIYERLKMYNVQTNM